MAGETQGMFKSYLAGAALASHVLVKMSGAVEQTIVVCGLDEGYLAIGVTVEPIANATFGTVRLLNAGGSVKIRVSEAVDINDFAYCAADGEASDTRGDGDPIGIFMEAGSADQSLVEVLIEKKTPRIVYGIHTTVAGVDTVVSGLQTVVAVLVSANDDPVDGAMTYTADIGDQAGSPAAGSFLLNGWKWTDGDATHVISTTFSIDVNYIAIGT